MSLPDDFSDHTINYDRVVEHTKFLAVTRMLAITLREQQYMTVGDFLKNISDGDLITLMHISENHEDPRYEEILLISQMLAEGEGISDMTLDGFTLRTNMLGTYLVIESLARKGLVKFHRENVSFDTDQGHKLIVEKMTPPDTK